MNRKLLLTLALISAFFLSHFFATPAFAAVACNNALSATPLGNNSYRLGFDTTRITNLDEETTWFYYSTVYGKSDGTNQNDIAFWSVDNARRGTYSGGNTVETLSPGNWKLSIIRGSLDSNGGEVCSINFTVAAPPVVAPPVTQPPTSTVVACAPAVSPSRIAPNSADPQTVSFGLPAGVNTICNGDGAVAGCAQIRYCEIGVPFRSCENNVNYALQNQSISGGTITGRPTPTTHERRFWLETGTGNGQRNNDTCGVRNGGVGITISTDAGGYCTNAWTITPQGGTSFTSTTPLGVQLDGSKTFGFPNYSGFAVAYSKVDGSGYTRFGDAITGGAGVCGSLSGGGWRIGPLSPGDYRVMIVDANIVGSEIYCASNFTVCQNGATNCSNEVTDSIGTEEDAMTGSFQRVSDFDYCKQAPDGPQRAACMACVGGNTGDQQKVYTAFGCMGTSGEDLTIDLVRLLLGVVGGIALLSILAAAFLLTTSQGEVSKVKSAKELITASVSGILFIIFSIMILNFIGVKILRIPGLL